MQVPKIPSITKATYKQKTENKKIFCTKKILNETENENVYELQKYDTET